MHRRHQRNCKQTRLAHVTMGVINDDHAHCFCFVLMVAISGGIFPLMQTSRALWLRDMLKSRLIVGSDMARRERQ